MVAEQMQTSKNMMHSSKIQQHGPPQAPHCQFFKFSFLSKLTCFNTLPEIVKSNNFLVRKTTFWQSISSVLH